MSSLEAEKAMEVMARSEPISEVLRNFESLPGQRIQRLSGAQCEAIHSASLEVLGRTGVRLHEPEAVKLLQEAGAEVSEGNRVRIPSGLVERALSTVPKRLVLYDRTGQPAVRMEGYRSAFGPGSDCLWILDHRTGQRRKPVLADLVEGMVLADRLPNIDFVMSMVLPTDVPTKVADRYQMEAMLNHTTKPVLFVTTELSGCVDAVEMAEAVAGGPDALRGKPFVACYVNATTGLRHNEEALQKLLYMAARRLPVVYIPVGLGGVTAPVTVAGCQVIWNVGALVGLVLSQLRQEGAPFIMAGWGAGALDMRTTVQAYADPDRRGVGAAMAHYYGLPMFGIGGCSDAKALDEQAGIEAALTLMMAALSGGQLVHDLGYLESGLCYSLAQLAICDEIVGWLEYCLRGVDVSQEALAVDLIDAVGPDGGFLNRSHTKQHYRSRWMPSLLDRWDHGTWRAQGGQTLQTRAAARVEEILAEHRPEPLPKGVARAVRAIVERAEARHA